MTTSTAAPSSHGSPGTGAGSQPFPAPERLEALQVLRGFAALAVLLFHGTHILADRLAYAFPGDFFGPGDCGVDVFFVLSGFIIHHTATRNRGARDFLTKRLIRIYPIYAVVTLLLVAAYFAAPSARMSHKGEFEVVLRSFLLLPAPRHVVGVAWTLIYELWFYLLFGALFFRSSRLFFAALAAWTVLACAKVAAGWAPASYALGFALNPIVGEFLLGCLASLAFSRGRTRHAGGVLALGLVGFALGWWEALDGVRELPRELAFGIPSTLVVYAAAHLREVRSRLLIFLGDASYSTYLVHGSAVSILVKALRAAGVERLPGGWLGALAVLAAALAVCCAFYRWVERPLLQACRRRFLG